MTKFLSQNYLAISLLKAKHDFFRENFITFSELNKFEYFIQQEFNNRNLNAIITSDGLSLEDFDILGDVIIPSNNCCYDINRLSIEILIILSDTKLISQFFMDLELEKIKTLENVQTSTLTLNKK